ncbi:response regulator transcription factor [Variovorax sp. J2P1-59]|uniref:response regulator transcription factor n=1 Tax=Variovorax flavidus TaxID=3053501 RepID=UPI002576FF4A|nr:response regulator transcription factor [Variovorax sp. J2P1-59]MDM0078453.1 response regulator transcription factor [Variovorax sp. J2P1-59]
MNQNALRPNILIFHPDPLLSAGLVAALRQQGTFEVYVFGVDHLGADGPSIDAVIADFDNAMRLVRRAERESNGIRGAARVLALTPNERETDIRRAIESGVHGYVLVGGPLGDLIDAVNAVAHGLRFVSATVAQRMADSLARASLTSREIEVLELVTAGQQNKSIARALCIELATVKSHMTAIMSKLGASTRTQAAQIAASRGLVREKGHVKRQQPARLSLAGCADEAGLQVA